MADTEKTAVVTEQENLTPAKPQEEITDIQIGTPKRKFRINGDNNLIVELNVGDLNIVSRLKEVYKKLDTLGGKAGSLLVAKEESTTEEDLERVSAALSDLDAEMRELVNYLFDYDVCSVCAKDMNMYTLYNGDFWFEHIITQLSGLYENNFKAEFEKMGKKISKHTSKYTRN